MTLTCDVLQESDMGSVTKNVRWFIKKDARRWKVGRIFRLSFSRCEQRSSWSRSNISSFISLFSTLYVSVTSNDIKLSVLHCLREKYEKRLIMCIQNAVFVSVMLWALEGKKGKKNSERWKVSFPFQEISLVCLFLPFFFIFLLCFCCCVFLFAQVKFSRIGNLMGWYQRDKRMKETITKHMEKHKWIIVVSYSACFASLVCSRRHLELLLLLAGSGCCCPPKKNTTTHKKKRLRWEKRGKMRTEKKK